MAHKPESFRLIEEGKNKKIIIYTNVEPSIGEKTLIEFYLKNGYAPMMEEKKAGVKVEEMRKALKGDEVRLKKFNELLEKKDFFGACKVYQNYMKEQKNKEQKNEE